MKITLVDTQTHEPYANRAVQIQIKNAGTGEILSTFALRTAQDGNVTIDQKYENQQLSASINGIRSSWIRAVDGAKLEVIISASTFAPKSTQNDIKNKTNQGMGYAEKQPVDKSEARGSNLKQEALDKTGKLTEKSGMKEKETQKGNFNIKNKSTEKL